MPEFAKSRITHHITNP